MGINSAIEDVKNSETGQVPMHLRNAPIEDMKNHPWFRGFKWKELYEKKMKSMNEREEWLELFIDECTLL